MDRSDKSPTQPDGNARKRREIRECKPVREWTAAERCEAFREARRLEREKAESGVVDEWECQDCPEKQLRAGS